MYSYPPPGWGKRLLGMVALILGIAVTARIIYELLVPLLPGLLAILLLGAIVSLFVRGRRG